MTDGTGLAEPLDEAWVQSAIGTAVKSRREALGLSMRAVAARAGVSQPFLSQLERGSTAASIATLYRLAGALGVPPTGLMPAPPVGDVVVARAEEGRRLVVSADPRATVGRLAAGDGARLQVTEYHVEPGETLGEWFETDGDIVIYMIAGELDVEVTGHGKWRLRAGDILFQPGALRRRWNQVGPDRTDLIVVWAAALLGT